VKHADECKDATFPLCLFYTFQVSNALNTKSRMWNQIFTTCNSENKIVDVN